MIMAWLKASRFIKISIFYWVLSATYDVSNNEDKLTNQSQKWVIIFWMKIKISSINNCGTCARFQNEFGRIKTLMGKLYFFEIGSRTLSEKLKSIIQ